MSPEVTTATAEAQILCATDGLVNDAPLGRGALWKLGVEPRQLDANVIHLRPGAEIAGHTEPDLDVLVLILHGEGTVKATTATHPVRAGMLLWLPRGSQRAITAGGSGLSYLTVHTRRPALRIGPRTNLAAECG